MFDLELKKNLEKVQSIAEDRTVKELVRMMQEGLIIACEKTIPKVKLGEKKVPWWSEKLTELRILVRVKQRKYLRTRERENYGAFFKSRTTYVYHVKKSINDKWKEMVTKGGNKNPWGKVYKIIGEKLKQEVVLARVRRESGITENIEDTVDMFLRVLLTDDIEEEDKDIHKDVRNEAKAVSVERDGEEVTSEEMDNVLKRISNGKAPGLDGIKREMVKRGWSSLRTMMVVILNRMFKGGIFPDIWKVGSVKVFLKGVDKDPAEVKSYRPVTLLPVLGKMAERVIAGKLKRHMDERNSLSERQCGFREGRGMREALVRLMEDVEGAEEKYVLVV